MTLLNVTGLTRSFGGLRAVDGVSFHVAEGEVVGLIGPNGSGKTTTFNLISGFLRPDSGEVSFGGRTVTYLPPHTMVGLGLARTWQDPRLFGHLTAIENVVLGFQSQPGENVLGALFTRFERHRPKFLERATKLLSDAGLADIAHEQGASLSYGQQKLVAFLRTVACDPKLVMLDEPAAGLSDTDVVTILDLIRTLRDRGTTFLLVDHNVDAVMEICNRVVVLDSGRKIADGAPDVIRNDPEVIRVYIGAPAAQ